MRARLVTLKKPGEDLDINDLEMAGKLLTWLMLKVIVIIKKIYYKHVGLFIDKMKVVPWTQMGSAKNSAAAGRLLRVLALRKILARASLLVAVHMAGELNVIDGITPRSFGYS